MTAAIAIALASAASAQNAATSAPPATMQATDPLKLPENVQLFGTAMPSVVKATAIVNGEVITQTDIDQRLAFMALEQDTQIPLDQITELRQQVLRNLIDETLQIQAAKRDDVGVKPSDLDRAVERIASGSKLTTAQFAELLRAKGSSIKSIRRHLESQLAWRRVQQARIENTVSVGDDEVQAALDRMKAAKGSTEYRVGEIFVSSSGVGEQQASANASRILEQLKQGQSFAAYARQYSEASTAAVGGDLGWVRPEQLPSQLSTILQQMQPGDISRPIPIPGGFSILAVSDVRKVLAPDPRDAQLNLKQISVSFPKGTTRAQAEPTVARLAAAAQNVGGCGGAERIATEFNGELSVAERTLRELPPVLQQMILPLQVGQATQPFGTIDDGVRVLVICGRDQVNPTLPTFEAVMSSMSEDRVNLRARRYLRDLRRDAVVEFR